MYHSTFYKVKFFRKTIKKVTYSLIYYADLLYNLLNKHRNNIKMLTKYKYTLCGATKHKFTRQT